MKNFEKQDIAIIGTGISGLWSAYWLVKHAKKGSFRSLVLFEKNSFVGGVLQNTTQGEYLLEHGAQGVLLSQEFFQNCLNELNLNSQIILPSQKQRHIMTSDNVVKISFGALLKSNLFRIQDFLRIFCEIFIQKKIKMNETLYDFFARRFGKKCADFFLVSLSFGIWGGGAHKILLRYAFPKLFQLEHGYGSVLKAAVFLKLKKLFQGSPSKPSGLASFPLGMGVLPQTLLKKLQELCLEKKILLTLQMHTCVERIEARENHEILLTFQSAHLQQSQTFCSVIYTGQPWREEKNIFSIQQYPAGEEALKNLKKIEAHDIIVVGLGSKSPPQKKTVTGFGALAGQWSKDLLGVLFVHSTYPCHCPEQACLYRVMLGGDRVPESTRTTFLSQNDDALIALAQERLLENKIVKEKINFDFQKVIRWEKYLPLATAHQDTVLESLWKIEGLIPGLFFAGNYLQGPAIAQCLEQAQKTAQSVLNYCDLK